MQRNVRLKKELQRLAKDAPDGTGRCRHCVCAFVLRCVEGVCVVCVCVSGVCVWPLEDGTIRASECNVRFQKHRHCVWLSVILSFSHRLSFLLPSTSSC